MPGNFANTYFGIQLAFQDAVSRNMNTTIIPSGSVVMVNSGTTTHYTVAACAPPQYYTLVLDNPDDFAAANTPEEATTKIVIHNPNKFIIKFNYLYSGQLANFNGNNDLKSEITSEITSEPREVITLALITVNTGKKIWVVLPETIIIKSF